MSDLKYCNACHQISEPESVEISPERSYGHGEYIQAEHEDRCPFCGSDELSEVAKCHSCKEWYDADSLTDHICEGCAKEAIELKAIHQIRCYHCDSIIDEWLHFGDHCFMCSASRVLNTINTITAALRAAKEI
jgi:hypothetical protein